MPNFNTLTFRQCIVRGQSDQITQKSKVNRVHRKPIKKTVDNALIDASWPLNRVVNYRKWSAKIESVASHPSKYRLVIYYSQLSKRGNFLSEVVSDFFFDLNSIKWIVAIGTIRFRHFILLSTGNSRLIGVVNIKIYIYSLGQEKNVMWKNLWQIHR